VLRLGTTAPHLDRLQEDSQRTRVGVSTLSVCEAMDSVSTLCVCEAMDSAPIRSCHRGTCV